LANFASAASSRGSAGVSFRSTGRFSETGVAATTGWLRSDMTVKRVARLITSQHTEERPTVPQRPVRVELAGSACLAPGKSPQGATGSAQPVPATDRPPVVENGGRRRERPELPNLITAPAAMATGTEIRSQSRAARKIAMRGSVS
jgi:hypothetical protein